MSAAGRFLGRSGKNAILLKLRVILGDESVEGGLTHFSTGRPAGGYVNAWNVGASLSLGPFGVIHNYSSLFESPRAVRGQRRRRPIEAELWRTPY